MPSVHLDACTFSHTTAATVLRDVTVGLGPGWTGVVGPNGAGKTTLLRLLAGELVPTSGTVRVAAGVRPVLCKQEVRAPDHAVVAFAGDWTGPAAALRSRLDLDPDDLDRWATLSPGERKRWQVGTVLSAEPDVLLLDEPTNHLDGHARQLLVDALCRFAGIGVVVSHDRTLLDDLTSSTIRVVHGTALLYTGPYEHAREAWMAEESAARAAHDRARREERRLRRVLGDVRHDRQGAERAPRAARRSGGPRDSDVREAGRKFAQQKAERKLARRVHQVRTRVERAEAAVADIDVPRTHAGPVGLEGGDDGRRVVARLAGDVVLPSGQVLLAGLDLVVPRGDHVHVAGRNGAGKSMLLRRLVEEAPGDVGWLPQEFSVADAAATLRTVRDLDPVQRGRCLGIVANLGVAPDRVLVSDEPSPGEARKLALALLLLHPVDLVVLDEPTNHLDLRSIERLEEAVAAFTGAVVVATHDDAFARATTSTSWEVGDGTVTVADGPAAGGAEGR